MMERWLVIGTDARMKLLAKRLMNDNRTVYYKCTNQWNTELNTVLLDYFPQKIILPIQPLRLEVERLQGIHQANFFAGKLTDKWRTLIGARPVAHYLQEEEYIWRNAALTAEAMLAHLYKGNRAVQHKRILITGFGRVAKMLANLLTRLHVHVIIAVRSDVQRAEALAYGYEAHILDTSLQVEADMCMNTIPAPWLDATYKFGAMPIYDLASAPGCLGGITVADYELLEALPGKYFPHEAAALLYETILQVDGG